MASILSWGGGPYHPTRAQTDALRAKLEPKGHRLRYTTVRAGFEPDSLRDTDLLILMGLDWSGMDALETGLWEDPRSRPGHYEPLTEEHFQAIQQYVERGGPLLCHHAAIGSFEERPEFEQIFDGRWIWGQSTHSPYEEFAVKVADRQHPMAAGIEDFRTTDELYYNLNGPRRSEVVLEAGYEGRMWPLAWAGTCSNAKVAYSGLGHDMAAWTNPYLQRFVLNTVQWLLEP